MHLSSPRTELRTLGRGPDARVVPPLLEQHADFATPWDLATLLEGAPGPLDVMVEAKAKDLAVLWLRSQTARLFPALAAAEERGGYAQRASRAPNSRWRQVASANARRLREIGTTPGSPRAG